MKRFEKNDEAFVCSVCGAKVEPLKYTSRDHCNKCLCSIHVDINPGDRQNTCLGVLRPISVVTSSKKGYIINYKCDKCGQLHNNKSASDDSFEKILEIMKENSLR